MNTHGSSSLTGLPDGGSLQMHHPEPSNKTLERDGAPPGWQLGVSDFIDVPLVASHPGD